jgi:hypothetical protein
MSATATATSESAAPPASATTGRPAALEAGSLKALAAAAGARTVSVAAVGSTGADFMVFAV